MIAKDNVYFFMQINEYLRSGMFFNSLKKIYNLSKIPDNIILDTFQNMTQSQFIEKYEIDTNYSTNTRMSLDSSEVVSSISHKSDKNIQLIKVERNENEIVGEFSDFDDH